MQRNAGLLVRGGDAVNVGLGNDPGAVAAIIGGSFIVVLIIAIGFQLFASARTANMYLTRAASLDSQSDDREKSPPNVVDANPTGSSGQDAVRVPGSPNTDQAAPADAARALWNRSNAQSPVPERVTATQTVVQLNQYYAANINQGTTIFWASLLSMSIGFAIIFIAVLTFRANSTVAIVAGVAGVLSQFIAATFLVALRSTQQQSTTYAQSLVEIRLREARATADAQSVLLGLRLLDEISSNAADLLANQTRATLATGLILKQAVAPVVFTPVVTPSADNDDTIRSPRNDSRVRAQSVTFDAVTSDESKRTPER